MPVIRCQACGKPNPDFLDVCQYCEARLKPMGTLGEPPTPAAPAAADADATLVSGPPAPASDATISTGNLMDRLRAMGAMSPAPDEPSAEAESAAVGDWLSRLRGAPKPGTGGLPADSDAAAEPDWMWAGPAGETPAPAADAPAAPTPAASTVPPEPDMPDWLKDPNAAPLPEAGPPPAKPRRKMTDWLNALGGEGAAPPPEIDEVPDWLKGLTSGQAVPPPAPKPAAPASPAEEDDTPDWLKSLRGGTSELVTSTARRQQGLPAHLRGDDQPPHTAEPPPAEPAAPAAVEPPRVPSHSQRMEAKPAWLRAEEQAAADDLAAAPPSEPAPPAPPAADATIPALAAAPLPPADDMPAWLRDIVTPADAEPAPAPERPKKKKMTDWLGAAPPPPASETPVDEVPDWLKTLSAGQAAPAEAPAAAPESDLPEWLRAAAGPAAVPAEAAPAEAAPAEAAPAEPAPGEFAPATPAADLPSWLSAMAPALPATPPPATPAVDVPDLDEETLSWLGQLSGAGQPAAEALPAEADVPLAPAELAAADVADLGEAADLDEAVPAEMPGWMAEFAAASQAETPAVPFAPEADQPGLQPTPEGELPEWLRALRGLPADAPAEEETPEWLRALRGLPETEPATVPASAPAARPAEQPAAAEAEAEPAAVPAALPAWLAAMRPVDIAQTAVLEDDTYQESLGVLSGMRGVLRAEPVVAHLHQAQPSDQRLELTDAQRANVRLLAELAPAEAVATVRAAPRARLGPLVERWVIFGVLALAIIVAQFQLPGLFGPPARITPEIDNAYEAVAGLGARSGAPGTPPLPLLLALDYEAGQQGELNPGVQAILSQALAQGNPVVLVSTKPEGAAVAQALLEASAAVYGEQVVNLGYLPGGPVGLLQFASAPRSSFAGDFTGALADVWAAPAAAGVERLEDFGLVVVAASSAQALRGWIEQTEFIAPAVPLVGVVSAGAEPMMRPYLQGADPQLAGMVAGVAGAAQYEREAGRLGTATALWPALGGGLWAAVVLIAAGNVVFGLLALLRRRRK